MTRQIVLDTETTGLNARTGDRIIEIGCVELVNRKLTGNNFHSYINPERDSEEGALAVHGLTTEFLRDKPKFSEVMNAFIEYVRDAEIIIHNAPFDVGFLNAEFARLNVSPFNDHVTQIIDTLVQAKELHPGKRNSLDALCTRYDISNSHRKLHGALLDAELLADVFLAMSRGQNSFSIEIKNEEKIQIIQESISDLPLPDIHIFRIPQSEIDAHELLLSGIDKEIRAKSIWRQDATD